jgi:hypothetical protein
MWRRRTKRWTAAQRFLGLASAGEEPGLVTATAASATAAIERVDLDAAALLLARTAALTSGLPPGHFTLLHDTTSLQLHLARGQLDEVRRRVGLLPEGGSSGTAPMPRRCCRCSHRSAAARAAFEQAAEIALVATNPNWGRQAAEELGRLG